MSQRQAPRKLPPPRPHPNARPASTAANSASPRRFFLSQPDPPWTDAWAVTEAIVIDMHRSVQKRSKWFLLITLSCSIQVDPDLDRRKAYAEQLGITDLFYADRRLAKFAQDNNIPALIMAPLLADYAATENIYLHGFPNTRTGRGHWNAKGHYAAAKLIANKPTEIVADEWPKSPGTPTCLQDTPSLYS